MGLRKSFSDTSLNHVQFSQLLPKVKDTQLPLRSCFLTWRIWVSPSSGLWSELALYLYFQFCLWVLLVVLTHLRYTTVACSGTTLHAHITYHNHWERDHLNTGLTLHLNLSLQSGQRRPTAKEVLSPIRTVVQVSSGDVREAGGDRRWEGR
jgi:hypothetical protein